MHFRLDGEGGMSAPDVHSRDEGLEALIGEWIEIEESTEIQEAMCNDAFDE